MASRARLLAPITLAALGAGAALSLARVFDGSGFVLPGARCRAAPVRDRRVRASPRLGRLRSRVGVSLLGLVVYVVYALEPSTTTVGRAAR